MDRRPFLALLLIGVLCTLAIGAPMPHLVRKSTPNAKNPVQTPAKTNDVAAHSTSDHFWFNNVTFVSQYELPEEDVGVFDTTHQRQYWVEIDDNGTKTPTWTKPAALDWRVLVDAITSRPYFRNDALDETTWDRPACLGWSKRSLGSVFYFNSITQESAWPHEVPEYVPLHTDQGVPYWYDKKTKTSTYDPPSEEAAWHTAESTKHERIGGKLRTYYFNALTKVSSWELPARSNLAWQKNHVEL